MAQPQNPRSSPRELDLHGLRPEQALARLRRELHTARVAGWPELTVVTGRGLGNRDQRPILRGHVERLLEAEGEALGVRGVRTGSGGGALVLRLGRA